MGQINTKVILNKSKSKESERGMSPHLPQTISYKPSNPLV